MFEILNAEISIWGILLATLAYMVMGIVWFSPLAFGNAWIAMMQKKNEELTAKPMDYVMTVLAAW